MGCLMLVNFWKRYYYSVKRESSIYIEGGDNSPNVPAEWRKRTDRHPDTFPHIRPLRYGGVAAGTPRAWCETAHRILTTGVNAMTTLQLKMRIVALKFAVTFVITLFAFAALAGISAAS